MSKFLDKAIKEMKSYGDMELPDGEPSGNKVVNAYKMNNILRRQQRAEEEEFNIDGAMRDENDEARMDDKDYKMDMPGDEGGAEMDMDMDIDMGDEEGMDDMGGDTEEIKSFFQDNPEPSDEEVVQFAQERGMDMEDMRKEVYALIQNLLGDSDPVGDGEADMEMGMDDEADMGDEIEFSAPINGDEEMRDEEEEAKAPANRDRDVQFQNTMRTRNKPTVADDNASTPNTKRLKQSYGRFKRGTWGGR
jgi:hypothetical protein